MSTPETHGQSPRVEVAQSMPVDRWHEAIGVRISRRAYATDPLDAASAATLRSTCERFLPFDGARVVLVEEAPAEMFTGWLLGRYGRVSSPSALVFLGDAGRTDAPERVGYTAEGVVLEAVSLGLGTCWIGGGVKRERVRDVVDVAPGERVYSISALGVSPEEQQRGERLTRGVTHAVRRRKDLETIAPGVGDWPSWAVAGVEAAQVAPSASNRQPWRFAWVDGAVEIGFVGSDTPMLSKRMDCGIAMLHFETAVRAAGVVGAWALHGPARPLARWTPATRAG